MNDASADPVEDHVEAVDGNGEKPWPTRALGDDQMDTMSNRLWFLESAFPMIAGTLGPVASAFSVCALVRPWRQSLPPGASITTAGYMDDPTWLTVINAVQLGIALAANCALLLNMTKRLRFAIAQPITFVGWYISALTLLALCATASGPLRPTTPDFVWSQAFYYGVYSTILYFIVATLMLCTFAGALWGLYDKDFDLTPSQRTLMLQTIMFLMYLLIGALVFSKVEGWYYLDAVYWADVTLFTVGFGDYAADTVLGRSLLFPYALVGVISLGLVIGSIRSLVLERGRKKMEARMVEKRRRKLLRSLTKKGQDGILEPIREDSDDLNDAGLTELERRNKEFQLMRTIQKKAEARRRWVAMGISTGTTAVLWLVGAKIFMEAESPWQPFNYFDGVYFTYVSLTTIGYGDVTPISNAGKSFFVFWSLLALPTMTVLISNAGDTVIKEIRDLTDQLGTVTILPGERGFKKDLKQLLKALSFGKLFEEGDEPREHVPGFFGNAERLEYRSDTETDGDETDADGIDRQDVGEIVAAERGAGPDEEQGSNLSQTQLHPDSALAKGKSMRRRGMSPSPSASSMTRQDTQNSATTSYSRTTTKNGSAPSTSHSHHRPQVSTADFAGRIKREASMPRQDLPLEIPANRADYHLLLIEEISCVMKHLQTHPPRKYTFQEWAWYLKLMGEDEANAETHRKAVPQPRHKLSGRLRGALNGRDNKTPSPGDGKGNASSSNAGSTGDDGVGEEGGEKPEYKGDDDNKNPDGQLNEQQPLAEPLSEGGPENTPEEQRHEQRHIQWSWVGLRSPLMSTQEEAQWILDKLVQKLTVELRQVKVDELNKSLAAKAAKAKIEKEMKAEEE